MQKLLEQAERYGHQAAYNETAARYHGGAEAATFAYNAVYQAYRSWRDQFSCDLQSHITDVFWNAYERQGLCATVGLESSNTQA